MELELWKSESSPGKQRATAIASAVIGLVLVMACRDLRVSDSNAMAGFFVGWLLLLIGLAGFLFSGKQVIVVDAKNRRITVEDSTTFHRKKRLIPFDTIDDVGIGYLGKASNYVGFYYLILRLKSGESYSLFAPGRFFAGGSDKSIVEGWRQRLQRCLNSS